MSRRKKPSGKSPKPEGKSQNSCGKPSDGDLLNSYQAIVRHYLKTRGCREDEVLQFYASLKSEDEAIRNAAYAKTHEGKLHRHQFLIQDKETCFKEAHKQLRSANLARCESFHELFELVKETIGTIPNIGALMVYDTAHRLGAFYKLSPDFVYLHAGAKEGAKSLGISKRWALPSEFPKAFHRLKPEQIEDCMCVYKDQLWELQRGKS